MTRALLAIVLSFGSALAAAQAFPTKPVTLLITFPAGGPTDIAGRALAEATSKYLGQPVVVENRPGAGGQIAMSALKAAAPDGQTLVMTPLVTVVTAPHVFPKLPYDAFTDFTPVAHTADFLFGFAIGPNVPAKTLAEFVALVKKEPRHGNYASAGAGSLPHFFSILFAQTAGINMTHIPYKGTAPALTDLLGGQISSFMGTASDLAAQHRAGKLRILATSGVARARVVGDAPTFKELGFNIEGAGWYAVYAPAKTPKETVDRLSGAIVAAIKAPDIREKLEALGMEPTGLGPEDLARIHRMDFDKWGPVIKASGFKPD